VAVGDRTIGGAPAVDDRTFQINAADYAGDTGMFDKLLIRAAGAEGSLVDLLPGAHPCESGSPRSDCTTVIFRRLGGVQPGAPSASVPSRCRGSGLDVEIALSRRAAVLYGSSMSIATIAA
jgi:hypothetical protein